MAYNNYFPTGYQPMQMYYPQAQMPQQAQVQNNGLVWVQGIEAAKSYLVAPNNTVALWDSESQSVYLKSADASGMPSMRILDYKIRDAVERTETPLKGSEQYVTVDSMAEMEKRLLERIKRLEEGEKE